MKGFKTRNPYMIAPNVQKGRSRYRYEFGCPFFEYTETKGCSWVTPHVMRHTFASLLASAGCSNRELEAGAVAQGLGAIERCDRLEGLEGIGGLQGRKIPLAVEMAGLPIGASTQVKAFNFDGRKGCFRKSATISL
jgi:hypothetical protein